MIRRPRQLQSPSFFSHWRRRLLIFLLLGLLALIATVLWPYLYRLPIHHIVIEGKFSHLNANEIKKISSLALNNYFFNFNGDDLKANLYRLPGIQEVEIRRIFPDRLIIRLIEQTPVARWNQNEFINDKGEAFHFALDYPNANQLPHLMGPPHQQWMLFHLYTRFKTKLASIGLSLNALQMTERGSYQLLVGDRLMIILGREKIETRLNKFLRVYPKLVKDANLSEANLNYIDLRYPNGLAIKQRSVASTAEEWQMMQILNQAE